MDEKYSPLFDLIYIRNYRRKRCKCLHRLVHRYFNQRKKFSLQMFLLLVLVLSKWFYLFYFRNVEILLDIFI